MSRALQNVPIQTPTPPEGLISAGGGRNYIYAENALAPAPNEESNEEERALPKPDLSTPPSD
jgi:penicillin-binding protein 1A